MRIKQYINDAGEFCAEIKSDKPIFVNYDQVTAMGLARGMEGVIEFFGKLENCPTPINQNTDIDDKLIDGIWFYDRLISFIDWSYDDIDQSIMRNALLSSQFEA